MDNKNRSSFIGWMVSSLWDYVSTKKEEDAEQPEEQKVTIDKLIEQAGCSKVNKIRVVVEQNLKGMFSEQGKLFKDFKVAHFKRVNPNNKSSINYDALAHYLILIDDKGTIYTIDPEGMYIAFDPLSGYKYAHLQIEGQ